MPEQLTRDNLKDHTVIAFFNYLFMEANQKDRFWFEGNIMVKRGQIIASVNTIANTLGLSEKQVRRYLDNFEKGGLITKKGSNRFTIITICDFDSYVGNFSILDEQRTSEHRAEDEQTESEHRPNEVQRESQEKAEEEPMATPYIEYSNIDTENKETISEKEIKKDGSENSKNFDLYKEYYTESEAREIVKLYNVQIKDEYIGNFTEINNVKYKYSAGILNALGKYLENNPKARKNAGQGKSQAPQPPAPATPAVPAVPAANVWLQKNTEQRERVGLMTDEQRAKVGL